MSKTKILKTSKSLHRSQKNLTLRMVIFLYFILCNFIFAELTTSPFPRARQELSQEAESTPDSLPRCVDDANVIDQIVTHVNNNRRNQYKYDKYKEVLSSDSDIQLWARLAYAEVLGANCPEQNQAVGETVVNVIGNRVQLRNGDIKSVVFQRDQFASSLNIYGSSRYRDFLCPKDSALWGNIMTQIQNFRQTSSGRLASNTVNYFLYKHDPRWTEAPWNYKEDTSISTPQTQSCIRAFHVPGWPFD